MAFDERARSTRARNARSQQHHRLARGVAGERRLFRAARRGDRGARERLVRVHLGLVRSVASQYRDNGMSFDDLVQEGSLGLLDAIDRYDTSLRIDFEAFARYRVRRAIRNALTDQTRLVRLPKQVVERRRMLDRLDAELTVAQGRASTPAELAAASGLSLQTVLQTRAAAITPLSLDAAAPDGSPLEDFIVDGTARDPEREMIAAERAQLVRDAVRDLPARQRYVVDKRFGLLGDEVAAARLARELRLSERRTRTIERDALHELAEKLEPVLAS